MPRLKGEDLKYGIVRKNNEVEYDKRRLQEQMERNPLVRLVSVAKYRAKKLGYEFTITKDYLILHEYCPILGIKLKFNPGKRKDNSYSIDRIDSTKGYIKGNVCVVSWKANRIKRDISMEFCERVIKYIKKYYKVGDF